MGAHVVLFTTSRSKVVDAERLGASEVCISTDDAQMARYANRLDFVLDTAEHGIVSDIETIPIDYVNAAYERMLKSDVKYRVVIDMGTLR